MMCKNLLRILLIGLLVCCFATQSSEEGDKVDSFIKDPKITGVAGLGIGLMAGFLFCYFFYKRPITLFGNSKLFVNGMYDPAGYNIRLYSNSGIYFVGDDKELLEKLIEQSKSYKEDESAVDTDGNPKTKITVKNGSYIWF